MSVYVDDMNANFHGMTMCHMVADSTDELIAMAVAIGVKVKWIQHQGTWKEHFDICLSKRKMAVKNGAIETTQMELARKMFTKKNDQKANE